MHNKSVPIGINIKPVNGKLWDPAQWCSKVDKTPSLKAENAKTTEKMHLKHVVDLLVNTLSFLSYVRD
jgi:hypothetical protein